MANDAPFAVVIGGGPAGLMAAEALLDAGRSVLVAEAKPTAGRKFLMAGKSGLNLAKIERFEACVTAYGAASARLKPMLEALPPPAVRAWAEALGQPCFVGSTGRLFPRAMKASPLLRAWRARLTQRGLDLRTKWRWRGWSGPALAFETPQGPRRLTPHRTILALGGASWARLGSDGAWAPLLAAKGVALTPFAPANAGLSVAWTPHMTKHFGAPLKAIALQAGTASSRGEVVLSARGLEGGGLYSLTPALRQGAALTIDFAPDLTAAQIAERLTKTPAKASLASRLRKALKLSPAGQAVLRENTPNMPRDEGLAAYLKEVPLRHSGLRPMDEAISTAGGVAWSALDANLMLTACPNVYVAGEMTDWEAPTGGYLIHACLATGRWAGEAAAAQI